MSGESGKPHIHWSHVILWGVVIALLGLQYTQYKVDQGLLGKVREVGQKLSDATSELHLLSDQQQQQLDALLFLLPDVPPDSPPADPSVKKHKRHHSSSATPTYTTTVTRTVVRKSSGGESTTPPTPTCSFQPPGKAVGRDSNKCPPGKGK